MAMEDKELFPGELDKTPRRAGAGAGTSPGPVWHSMKRAAPAAPERWGDTWQHNSSKAERGALAPESILVGETHTSLHGAPPKKGLATNGCLGPGEL